ncbi:MAG: hypothetical protein R3F29_11730 [Planctomycetota bacterium]
MRYPAEVKAFPVAVIALAIVVGIVWLWSRSVEASLPPGAPDGRDAGALTAAAADAPLHGMPQHRVERDAVDPVTAPEGSRVDDLLHEVQLEIVDTLGAPVADAEVCYLPPMPDTERDAAAADPQTAGDDEVMLRRHGRSTKSDQSGLLDLTIDPDSPVTARRGETFAICWPEPPLPGMPRERMVLAPDVHLRVQVVDGDGAPVRDVGLFAESEGRSPRRGVFEHSAQLGWTDVDGWVRIPHLQERLELPHPDDFGELRLRLGTGGDYQRSDLLTQTLPAKVLHGEVERRLVSVGSGAIEVRICDADGAPIRANLVLNLETGEAFESNPERRDGVSRFAPVPLGRRWQLVAWHPRQTAAWASERIDGPRTANETVSTELRLMVREFSFRARIVDRDGAPVPSATVKAKSVRLPLELDWNTYAEGKLQLGPFATDAAVAVMDLTLTASSPLINTRQFSFDTLFAKGEHDLGDLVVDRQPGQPLLASIELRCGGEPVLGPATIQLLQHLPPPNQYSPRLEPVPATVYRDGAMFELRGPLPEQPMRAICRGANGELQVLDPLPPGAHRIVDLQPAADLVIAIEAPDVPIDDIYGELVLRGERGGTHQSADPRQQTLRWKGLAPGRYSVRLIVGDRLLWSCPSLELQPGNNRLPADGSRLDLRGRAEARLLRVRSADSGQDLPADVIEVEAGGNELPPGDDWNYLHDWFVLHEPPDDLLVAAEGHVPLRVSAPGDDVDVRLQRSIEVELDIDIDAEHSSVRGRLVYDPLLDPLLRAFDAFNVHAAEFDAEDVDLFFVPGAIVDFWLELDGKRGKPVRVELGAEPLQVVQLR